MKADDLRKKTLQSEDVCDELIALLLDGLDQVCHVAVCSYVSRT